MSGVVYSLNPDFGNGGVGYIRDNKGTEYFFHSRYVADGLYRELLVGSEVTFTPIAARRAMGAGPQARNVCMKENALNK